MTEHEKIDLLMSMAGDDRYTEKVQDACRDGAYAICREISYRAILDSRPMFYPWVKMSELLPDGESQVLVRRDFTGCFEVAYADRAREYSYLYSHWTRIPEVK